MMVISALIPKNKPSLKNWIEKHNVSGQLMSSKLAVKKAVRYEQSKYEMNETI